MRIDAWAGGIGLEPGRARELGLDNTHFVDISGRDPEDLNEIGEIRHRPTATATSSTSRRAFTIPPRAIWPGWPASLSTIRCSSRSRSPTAGRRASGNGVKTGTSNQAGSNLVSAATRRECQGDAPCINRDVIAVALGSAADGTATGDRFSDSRSLREFGLFA